MSNTFLPFLVIAFGIGFSFYQQAGLSSALLDWTYELGYEMVESKLVWIGGPFWWRSRQGATYKVVVKAEKDPVLREGWVFVPFPVSFFTNGVEVIWADERRSSYR